MSKLRIHCQLKAPEQRSGKVLQVGTWDLLVLLGVTDKHHAGWHAPITANSIALADDLPAIPLLSFK